MGKKPFYKTDSFLKLKKEWDKKLPSNLQISDKEEYVIQPEVFSTKKSQIEGGLDYLAFCQQILREFRFKKDLHRKIFELHTDGRSVREISDELEKEGLSLRKSAINDLIIRTKEAFLKGVE